MLEQGFAFPETLAGRGFIIATYYAELPAESDLIGRAASFAMGQSVGTWTPVPGVTPEMLEHHSARIVGLYDVPPVELAPHLQPGPRRALVQIAFPEANFGSQIPMLFTTLLGNDASTSAQLKLVDLQLSPGFAAGFAGPRFGVQGLRELLGVPERALLLNMIKPCTGFTPEVGASFFRAVALGGVDIIKDDELLGNPSFCPLIDRVKAYCEADRQVYEETGHRTMYCANVTDRPDRILDNAHRAQDAGAGMLMLNAISAGLGMVQALAEDPEIRVPLYTHYAGAGTMTESPVSGISSPLLLGKLSRLAGADVATFSSVYSAYPITRDKYLRTAQFLRMPLFHIKPSMPSVGGGLHPGMAVRMIKDLGHDLVLPTGGGIQGHPGGAAAGARAMRQAIDAALAGVPLREYAAGHPELQQSLDKWGE